MKLSEELKWRGFVNQTTLQDTSKLDEENFTFYLGVDPSAPSMTIGNLAVMMLVLHFAKAGHRPYLLIGGATGLIGDPDGKKQEREKKDISVIESNVDLISRQFEQLAPDIQVVNNYDWFKNINFIEFLTDIGKHVPMRQMLNREFIQARLGEHGAGISYAEFSYVLIQAYDFLYLNEKYGINLQICGSDQWGNSIAGVDLIRRKTGQESHVWSAPLVINKTTGVKFGKSEDGAVWLDEKLTSVYRFYQFWLNVDDQGVVDYLKIYTLLDKSSIEDLETKTLQNPSARSAQKALAYEVTTIVHGQEAAESAVKVTDVLFGRNQLSDLTSKEIAMLSREIPTVNLLGDSVGKEAALSKTAISRILVESAVANSLGEARRLISGNAICVNGMKITEDINLSEPAIIKKGKNTFILVQ